jgi:hypothetical protein
VPDIATVEISPEGSGAVVASPIIAVMFLIAATGGCRRIEPIIRRKSEQENIVRKAIRGYAKDKNLNLILIGMIPVPYSKDKRSPRERQDKRYLVRQGATIFKKETIR